MDKYVVLRTADIQHFVQPPLRQSLLSVINAINAGRQANGKTQGDMFWPLNMKDKYALAALEAYIAAAESDPAARDNPEVQAILKEARELHTKAVFAFVPSLPT